MKIDLKVIENLKNTVYIYILRHIISINNKLKVLLLLEYTVTLIIMYSNNSSNDRSSVTSKRCLSKALTIGLLCNIAIARRKSILSTFVAAGRSGDLVQSA